MESVLESNASEQVRMSAMDSATENEELERELRCKYNQAR